MPKYEVALGPNEAYLTDDLHIQVVEAHLANGRFYEPQISVNGKWRSVSKDYQSFHKTKADAWRAIYQNITRTDRSQEQVSDLAAFRLLASMDSANPPRGEANT